MSSEPAARSAWPLDAGEAGAQPDQTTTGYDIVGERQADLPEVDDAGRLDPQGLDAGDVGFVAPGLGRRHQPSRYAVGGGPVGERVQPGHLLGAGGHDELAGGLDGDTAVAGEGGHRLRPRTAMVALRLPGG